MILLMPFPKYWMRYKDITDAANDNAKDRPIDRRDTANLALDIAAQKLADETGITALQARRKLQQQEHLKRNAADMRKQYWKDKEES